MRHTLIGKRAQAPRHAHRFLDPSTGSAVYHGAIHIATMFAGDGNSSVYTVASKLIGCFGSDSEAPRAGPSPGRKS